MKNKPTSWIKKRLLQVLLALTLTGGSVIANAQDSQTASQPPAAGKATVDQATVQQIIATWQAEPKQEAQVLMQKYGQPQEATKDMLIWKNNGPWKRTELVNEEIPHDFPIPHHDFLKQTIDYKVQMDKYGELARFDGSLLTDRTPGELSARCDKDENNLLAINLANDICTGKSSVEDARQRYLKDAVAAKQGQKPAYTQSLQFQTPVSRTGDPDQSLQPQGAQSNPAQPK